MTLTYFLTKLTIGQEKSVILRIFIKINCDYSYKKRTFIYIKVRKQNKGLGL